MGSESNKRPGKLPGSSRSLFQEDVMRRSLACLTAGSAVFIVSSANAVTIFVDHSATGANNGGSWPNAYTTLTAGLNHSGLTAGDVIQVADGTYKPTTGTSRFATFSLVDGVVVLGGWEGASNPSAPRNPVANVTILSGDINSIRDSYQFLTAAWV